MNFCFHKLERQKKEPVLNFTSEITCCLNLDYLKGNSGAYKRMVHYDDVKRYCKENNRV
jgi:hypothetical protein